MSNAGQIELLAPAGGMDQLKAAVNFGANAVYLAGQQFGMRAKAANFADEELKSAVDYAHARGVRVYVTCNILMHDADVAQLESYFVMLNQAGVDAVILGDLGALAVVKEVAPDLDIHVSTQASVANARAAIEWAKLGAKRIVLAREMSLAEIAGMRQKLDEAGFADQDSNPNAIALEAFVHGAMCMSVSGRCLISSYLTGRSANKGLCTQPCRWGYSLEEENRPRQKFGIAEDDYGTYIMNSKDLNMLSYLDKVVEAGVSSLKIEGRNKKAMYVATVVNAYRHVLDYLEAHEKPEPTASGTIESEGLGTQNSKFDHAEFDRFTTKWQQELVNISHRPYATGFYFGMAEQSPDYDGYEQNTVHVADVLACEPMKNDQDTYVVQVLCRNRFENGEKLEALIPGQDIKVLTVDNLKWIQENKIMGNFVDVANRAKEIYTFTCPFEITTGSLLRSKTFLRTSR